MFAYRFVLFLAVVLLAVGVGYAALSSDRATTPEPRVSQQAMNSASQQDAAISKWAAEQGMEFVPAQRRNDEVLLTGNTIVMNENLNDDHAVRGNQGRGVTVEADRNGGPPKIVYGTEKTETRKRFRITSIADLTRLKEEDVRNLEEGDVDVDIYRLRDDINGGLIGLGETLRQLDQSYHVPGVSGATSSTGAMHWAPNARVEQARKEKARRLKERAMRQQQEQRRDVVILP